MKRQTLLIRLISAYLIALFMSGCVDDLRGRSVFDAGAGEALIQFSVDNISKSRADGGADRESLIDHAYLLFYPSDASVDKSLPLACVRAEISSENPTALSFRMPLSLLPDTDYQLVALANMDAYLPEGFNSYKDYIESFCRNHTEGEPTELLAYRSGCIAASDDLLLPMRGRSRNEESFRFSMKNGRYVISMSLLFRRLVARIDVANAVGRGFDVLGVALCNWRDAVSATASDGMVGNRLGKVCGVLSGEDVDGGVAAFMEMPQPDGGGVQQLKEAIYCLPSVCYDSHPSDTESTALIIKALYADDIEPTYYRVNVGVVGNKAEVKANTRYLVAIQSVKGRGAASAREAYASEGSQLVLSVVEDWDLEGESFAMDEKGNFIVLSSGRLEFPGDSDEKRMVKVLASKGMIWSLSFEADNEESAAAFSFSSVSDGSLLIGPKGLNEGNAPLSGKFIVSSSTPEGENLRDIDIYVVQNPASGQPKEPVVPEDMPFALIPESYDRVKIDHAAKTIEIDGFDPDCFNSFIDIAFTLYVKDPEISEVSVSSTLEWPLEGRVSCDRSSMYIYCSKSFSTTGTRQVSDKNGSLLTLEAGPVSLSNGRTVYISVGSMGPDDPAISGRCISITSPDGTEVKYWLTVRPRPAIIDDIVLFDDSGKAWLVQDRNIQDVEDYGAYIGLDSKGKKLQAYNYSQIAQFSTSVLIYIPFKFDGDNLSFSEISHGLYHGISVPYKSRTDLSGSKSGSRLFWLKQYSRQGDYEMTSPFYEADGDDGYQHWIFPTIDLMEQMRQKMCVSKMRMFLVSEVPVMNGVVTIPVCCYLPYYMASATSFDDDSDGYFASSSGTAPELIRFFCIDKECVKLLRATISNPCALSRLVRPLTDTQLESYKNDYLGYGSKPHRLIICHPDTYDPSTGWVPK